MAEHNHSLDLGGTAMVAVSRESLLSLRDALFRDLGISAATYLQDAGYTGAAALYDTFAAWLHMRGFGVPETVPSAEFAALLSTFFSEAGWGTLTLGSLGSGIATFDSPDWAEADPVHALEFPGCYFTSGVLADLFGRLADAPVAVMEVECRSMGGDRCLFLLGDGAAIQHVYDEMSKGVGYEDALGAASAGPFE